MTQAQARENLETVMIVEDEQMVAMCLFDELQAAGYKVLNLTDRQAEALQVAKAEKPHLALVNIALAGGDDGIELSEHFEGHGDTGLADQRTGQPGQFGQDSGDRLHAQTL